MIKTASVWNDARNQISQTIAIVQLTIHHAKHLIPATEVLNIFISLMPFSNTIEELMRQEADYLSKNELSLIHKLNFNQSINQIVPNLKMTETFTRQAFQRT